MYHIIMMQQFASTVTSIIIILSTIELDWKQKYNIILNMSYLYFHFHSSMVQILINILTNGVMLQSSKNIRYLDILCHINIKHYNITCNHLLSAIPWMSLDTIKTHINAYKLSNYPLLIKAMWSYLIILWLQQNGIWYSLSYFVKNTMSILSRNLMNVAELYFGKLSDKHVGEFCYYVYILIIYFLFEYLIFG